MKKPLVLIIALFCVLAASAQDIAINRFRNETQRTVKKDADTSKWNWKRGGLFSFNLSQGSLSNWSSGGDNFSLIANGYFNYFFFYRKGRHYWDNNVDVNMGYIQTTSIGSRKNDDRFDFLSKYGYKLDTVGKWYLTTLFNLRSQFFDGYTYSNNVGDFSSSFLSPAYLIASLGFDYKQGPNLSIFVSPLTTRYTILANNYLANKGGYGVTPGQHILKEIGAFATINYNNTIAKNVTYKGRMDLFSNYENQAQNVDFFMTNLFSFKISRFFSATYALDMIYDDNIRLFGPTNSSPGLQTKSLIGIGFLKPLNVRKIISN